MAQTSCPDMTNSRVNGDATSGTCTLGGSTPVNGFVYRTNPGFCRNFGRAVVQGRDSGVAEPPTSLSCPGCTTVSGDRIAFAADGSSTFTATFNVNGNTTTIAISGTYSRVGNSCTFSNVTATGGNFGPTTDSSKDATRAFLARRLDRLVTEEPDRNRFVRRLTGTPWGQPGTFGFSDSNGTTNLNFSGSLSQLGAASVRKHTHTSTLADGASMLGYRTGSIKDAPLTRPTLDVWAEGHYTHYEDDVSNGKSDGDFGLLYLGADYLVTSNVLFGVLVQFDWSDEDMQTTDGNIDGRGWMAGPYLSARLSENLFFNSRAAWGQSDNDIRIGTTTGSFDTDRWLVSSDLTGNWRNGAWRFTPSVGIAYAQEDQDRYTNSAGTVVPSQTVSLGRVTFGPEVAYRMAAGGGTFIEPMASLKGLWDFDNEGNLVIDGIVASPDDFRGRFEGGVIVTVPGGLALRATGNYDGIGSGDFEAYGGELWVSLPLN